MEIDYIEFIVRDIEETKGFFGSAFAWNFTDYGPEYASFDDGRLTGGFAKGEPVPGGPLVILRSDDLEATRAAVVSAGGTIVKEIFAFPGGRRFHFADPSGNVLAVWSEK
jgi:predicted enzyme related to lactoylglutathione lyase